MFVISRPLLSTPLRSRKTAKVVGGQRNEEAMGVKDESCLWVDLTAVDVHGAEAYKDELQSKDLGNRADLDSSPN